MRKKKNEIREKARELYYNLGRSIEDIAAELIKSKRTIYRYLNLSNKENLAVSHKPKKKPGRPKRYPPKIINRIIEIKKELPQRSAPMVHKLVKEEVPDNCPSLPYVRKIIQDNGLSNQTSNHGQGYIRFQRKKPNDLWQIDIAGVETVGHLKEVYLIALLDDCSRFVVAAQYFREQTTPNVIKVVRNAILAHGRPNQILADNGTQFKNVLGELATKYSKMLRSLGIKPIFARAQHPQTKGKLERWFRTVKQMFLIEARYHVKTNPDCTFAELRRMLEDWVKWYNTKKSHRSLPDKCPPAKIFFETEDRVYRPLQAKVNWNRWLNEVSQRKVNKYNEIHYKAQLFSVPPGYSGLKIEVIEYEDKIEIYYKNNLIITHPYDAIIKPEKTIKNTRKIRKNGSIAYKGKSYSIDYKLAHKTVEVQESDDGRKLLVYHRGILIKTLNP